MLNGEASLTTRAPPAGLGHSALFYDSPATYQAGVAGFVEDGLAAGEPALIAVPAARICLLRPSLGGLTGPAGPVAFTDMAGLGRNPGRIIPAIRGFTEAHRGRRVRFVGEPVWPGRTQAETQEAIRHEALINLAFTAAPAAILCPYDIMGLSAEVLAGACATHPVVIEHGRSRPSPAYAGGVVPAGCDWPLPAPPATSRRLAFSAATGLAPVRALAASCAASAGLAAGRAADLVLAVSELAANTLKHTAGGGTMQAWQAHGRLICQIRDSGTISDPLAGRYRRPVGPAGGQGLWVVHQVCDLVELRTGPAGTTVRVHARLHQT